MEVKYKVGDIVYYMKKEYGEHRVEKVDGNEVKLSTNKYFGEGKDTFWTNTERIEFKKHETDE
jgi:hypothetical protein